MKKINILLILILCMTGCKKEADTTSITGEIKGLGNDTIYLYGVDGLYEQIDTICVKGDKFSHSLKIDTITSAVLLFKKNTEYPIFLDKKNKIKIAGNVNNLSCLNINGNIYNEEFSAFQACKSLTPRRIKHLKKKPKHLSANTTFLLPVSICSTNILFRKKTPISIKLKSLSTSWPESYRTNLVSDNLQNISANWKK